ncbi:serine/threonine-protein kinase pim-1-like [Danio rerio]|uniref:Serine/threonine-protein kinase pim-1-like n=1 Tax=Danio rerio TaxID=7955 RepID=A0AC58GLB4_DANRE
MNFHILSGFSCFIAGWRRLSMSHMGEERGAIPDPGVLLSPRQQLWTQTHRTTPLSFLDIWLLCLHIWLILHPQTRGKGKAAASKHRPPLPRDRPNALAEGPLLGRGGFGSVFAGVRRSDGLPVDIKYVSKDRTPETLKVDGQGRLPLEVALKSHITSAPACPSVLQLLDWFDRPRCYILILERPAPCQDLQSFCEENGCLDEHLVKELHRDVKPENLLISTESQDIKLLDFGCGDLLKRSAYKYFAGTPAFTPPEWFSRHRYNATPATVWSVGVTLYNILCDRFPFRGA